MSKIAIVAAFSPPEISTASLPPSGDQLTRTAATCANSVILPVSVSRSSNRRELPSVSSAIKATFDPSPKIAVAWIWLKSPYVRHFFSETEYTPTAQRTFHVLLRSSATGNPQEMLRAPGPMLAVARGRLRLPTGTLSVSRWSVATNLRVESVAWNNRTESGTENVPLPFACENVTASKINARGYTKKFLAVIEPPSPEHIPES